MNIGLKMVERGINMLPKPVAREYMTKSIKTKLYQRQTKELKEGKYEPDSFKQACLDEFQEQTGLMIQFNRIDLPLPEISKLIDEVVAMPAEIEDSTDCKNPYQGTGRNDPCPCGSGKKYKKCHGR